MKKNLAESIFAFKISSTVTWVLISVLIFLVFIALRITFFTGGRSSNTNVAVIHYADYITDTLMDLIEKFNKENEGNIKVIPINLPFSKFSTNERKELLARSLRSKSDQIDVFAVDIIWVYRFAKWAEPLGKFFSTVQREKTIRYTMESCYYNDQLVAMPFKVDLSTMFYRKDILKSLPDFELYEKELQNSITWERFINLKKSINISDKPFYTFAADSYEGLVCSYIEAILNQDRDFFARGQVNFSREESKKALELLVDLVNKYEMTPKAAINFTEYLCHNYFIKNDGLFLRSWPTFINEYDEFITDTTINYELVPVPMPHFEGFKHANMFGGWNLMISKFSRHKSESVKFINFLLEESSQIELFVNDGSIPVLKNIFENYKDYPKTETLQYYDEQFKYGVYRPALEDYTRISDIISHFVNKAIRKEISVKEALAQADEMINSDKVIIH